MKKLQEKVISVKRNDQFIGSLVVDGTDISENSIKVYNFDSNGSIKSNFYKLPKNCATIGITKLIDININFLCIDSGKIVFKKLFLK